MTSPRGRLTAVTVACVVFGLAALVAAWRSPESDGFTVLATAAGWPWAWAVLEGDLVWRRGRAMQSSGLEHALATYAAGGVWAALLGTLSLSSPGGWSFAEGLRLRCGPLEPLCAALRCMAVACVMCGWTLGFVFPADSSSRRCCRPLPPGPAPSWLGERLPSQTWMRGAVAFTTACWLLVLLTGLVLAFA